MRNYSVLISLTFALVSGAVADTTPSSKWSLLVEGAYHKDEAPLHPGTGWLALVQKQNKWELVPAKVTATRAHDQIVDGPHEKTAVDISASERNSIALIRHPKVKKGFVSVPATTDGKLSRYFDTDKTPWAVSFNEKQYTFNIERNKLVLKQGAKTSELGDLINDSDITTSVAWIGDLDGDGGLDIVTVNGSNNYQAHCLYLSSSATPGATVKQVGCHGGSGC
jgi:hypothetical protein